jgi:hypothetical protein
MQGELARLEESSEERAQRMATRARELLRRREEERQAVADAMAEKKWRCVPCAWYLWVGEC